MRLMLALVAPRPFRWAFGAVCLAAAGARAQVVTRN
jgi:hypothetical protein